MFGHLPVVDYLVSAGADVNESCDVSEVDLGTWLMGKHEIVDFYLRLPTNLCFRMDGHV